MPAKKLSRLGTLIATLALAGCSQGFQAAPTSGGSNSSSSTGNGISSPADAASSFKSLAVDGSVSGYDSVQVIELDKANMMLIVRLPTPIPSLSFSTAAVTIPQIRGATLGVESLASGGSALTLRIPLAALMAKNGVALSSPSKLPNGDALPGIPDGELPSVAVTLSKVGQIDPTIYMSQSVVAIYVPSPYTLPIGLTLPIRNAAHTRTWGYVSSIAAKGLTKGGFFVSLAIPDDIARIIDNVM